MYAAYPWYKVLGGIRNEDATAMASSTDFIPSGRCCNPVQGPEITHAATDEIMSSAQVVTAISQWFFWHSKCFTFPVYAKIQWLNLEGLLFISSFSCTLPFQLFPRSESRTWAFNSSIIELYPWLSPKMSCCHMLSRFHHVITFSESIESEFLLIP